MSSPIRPSPTRPGPTGLTLGESGEGDRHKRFTWGLPPKKQGDFAYLLHIIRSMKSTGKGSCILPHGVLFRGNAEAVIRRRALSGSGYLKGIIGLPANLFFGTGIPACIVVLDKENAAAQFFFFFFASKGFRKDGPKNRLREQDIHRIVDIFPSERMRATRAMPDWCRSRRSQIRKTTSTSTCRATSTALSAKTFRTWTAICAAAFLSATSMR